MITLNKKTLVSTSVGTLMAAAGGLWVVAGDFNEAQAQIDQNTMSIKSMEIQWIDSDLRDLKKERRELNREMRAHPNDLILLEDSEENADDIAELMEVKECLLNPEVDVCR